MRGRSQLHCSCGGVAVAYAKGGCGSRELSCGCTSAAACSLPRVPHNAAMSDQCSWGRLSLQRPTNPGQCEATDSHSEQNTGDCTTGQAYTNALQQAQQRNPRPDDETRRDDTPARAKGGCSATLGTSPGPNDGLATHWLLTIEPGRRPDTQQHPLLLRTRLKSPRPLVSNHQLPKSRISPNPTLDPTALRLSAPRVIPRTPQLPSAAIPMLLPGPDCPS